ncbi:MAG: terminase family protein [Patescibacteria group bacterium]|nr:terminase family protein [Patescibacteria group bacterium]
MLAELKSALSSTSLDPSSLVRMLEEMDRELASRDRLSEYQPYPKQAEFHIAGATFRERMLMAGNQVGKTLSAGMETAMHLTGRYPKGWAGKRFDRPVRWIAGSESTELTRKGVQRILLGPPENRDVWGTGAIPQECLVGSPTMRPGVPDAVAGINVRHVSGALSNIQLQSYDQGRTKWQADTLDGAWLDEEPPVDIYYEVLTRTNTTLGPVYVTLTPLLGVSEIVKRFYLDKEPNTHLTMMSIEDAAHFGPEQRATIMASYPEFEREARTLGIPQLGSGRVFPVLQEAILCEAMPIPTHWPRIGGLDFGWDHPSAGVILAWDRDADVLYVTHAYRAREQTPLIFAGAVKPWGNWPWAWPHDGLQHDKGSGDQLAQLYRNQGLNMLPQRATFEDGSNSLEAGVTQMLERMQTGRLKVFRHLVEWVEEFNLYHRKDGLIVKMRDDLLSATRYALMMRRFAKTAEELKPRRKLYIAPPPGQPQGWMGA